MGKRFISSYLAFTLVELLVVVAIMGIIAAVAGPTFKRYQTSAIIGDIRQRAEVFSKMQQIYFYKNGEFAWRSQLGLPPDPTNGGCSGCVDLSYLGPDVSDYVSSI